MKLNPEQKKAVEHVSGPLLIIAGAGTGKTKVITSKILHLFEEKIANPAEILALTFTEKAANEMLERVDIAMPLGYEEICIKTFHAFADQVLRESGLEIGIDPGYKILMQVEQWFFFKENLFEFELDYYRPLGNPNRFIHELLGHFSKLKDELVEPNAYIDYAEKIEGEEGEKMLEVAKTYKKYQELLIVNNYLDFGDLVFYANKLFEKRESVLKNYQTRFKYILIDEFQDTNYAQFQLILKLVKDQKNITVVGDDDQSIYKWRGASLSNILQFQDYFPDATNIVLTENYRSEKAILDSAYELIQQNNPDRLEAKLNIVKKLNCNVEGNSLVEVHEFPNFIQESKYVIKQIRKIKEKNGAGYENFAILIRANQQANPFIDELKLNGIPFQVRNPKGLLGLDEIKDLIAVLKVIANPKDDISLLRVLKIPIFEIAMKEILDLLHDEKSLPLFEKINLSEENLTLPGTESGLIKIKQILLHLIDFSKNQPVGLVINEFLQTSGILEDLMKNEKYEILENLNEFAKQINKFTKSNENNTVLDFINYLNLLEEANSTLASDSFADRESVQILTVHGSKGLEFDYVFIVNAVKQRFPSTKRSETFEIPETLTKEIYSEGDFHLQEERRLFYVAMTRAKKQLFITYSNQYEGNKAWKASPFVEEISNNPLVKKTVHEAEADVLSQLKQFKEPAKPILESPKFDKKRLSYSQFETFETCPLKYSYRYLLSIPTPSAHASNFGSSVHETLNEFSRILKRGEVISLELFEELYKKNWIPYGYDSYEHEQERFKKGWEILKIFYETNSKPWIVPAFLEKPFNLKIGDYWINGRIDRIDKLEDGTYEVIDYKTGRLKDDLKLDKDFQLSVYALACRDVFKIPVSKLSLYFLEDNKKLSTTRSEKDLEGLHEHILELIRKMKDSKFEPTPGFHCQFCDFRMICPAV